METNVAPRIVVQQVFDEYEKNSQFLRLQNKNKLLDIKYAMLDQVII
jgi:hypothetical protein